MTKPAGYSVTDSLGRSALMQDQARAVDKAAMQKGTVTPLFSIKQIVAALEGDGLDDAAEAVRELGLETLE